MRRDMNVSKLCGFLRARTYGAKSKWVYKGFVKWPAHIQYEILRLHFAE